MQNKEYTVEYLPFQAKRICLALDLKDNPGLIAQYKYYHSPEAFWMEIGEGIRRAGISVMDIYNVDNRIFMICEVPLEIDFDLAWNSVGQYERQNEWSKMMDNFIKALPGHKLEWVKLEKIFSIPTL